MLLTGLKLKVARAREVANAVLSEEFEQEKKNLGCGERVAGGAMTIANLNGKMLRERVESVIGDVGYDATGERDGAQVWVSHAATGKDARQFVINEANVEGRVVRDEYGGVNEAEPVGGDVAEERGVFNHRVGDAGEVSDERRDICFRVDQRLKLGDDTAPADPVRADFRDAAPRRFGAGRFDINHDKIRFGERAAFGVFAQKLDFGVVNDSHSPVVFDEFINDRSGDERLKVGQMQHLVGHQLDRRAPAAQAQHLNCLLDEWRIRNEIGKLLHGETLLARATERQGTYGF